MNLDLFLSHYKPIPNPQSSHLGFNLDGEVNFGFETTGSDIVKINEANKRHVWTVIESDSGSDFHLVNGFRTINRICYFMTEQPWPLNQTIIIRFDDKPIPPIFEDKERQVLLCAIAAATFHLSDNTDFEGHLINLTRNFGDNDYNLMFLAFTKHQVIRFVSQPLHCQVMLQVMAKKEVIDYLHQCANKELDGHFFTQINQDLESMYIRGQCRQNSDSARIYKGLEAYLAPLVLSENEPNQHQRLSA